ncbi:MAG TPA: glycosyltransferase [Candidatus Avilachnospira avistercoris]|nr:glycosyltransferase [Candidatus Avilachnospira avistercoris]
MNDFIYGLVEALENKDEREVLRESTDPRYYYALSEDRGNIIDWFPFSKDEDVLFFGACYGAFLKLRKRVRSLDIMESSELQQAVVRKRIRGDEELSNIGLYKLEPKKLYDIVIVPVLDESLFDSAKLSREELYPLLSYYGSFLKEGGSLIMAADNSDSLRFFSGLEKREGECCFSLDETRDAFSRLPFDDFSFYYPLPDKAFARDIYSESYMPKEGDFRGTAQSFSGESLALCDEERLYGRLCDEGKFQVFAPSFLVIASGYKGAHTDKVVLMSEPKAKGAAGKDLPIYIRYNRSRDEQFRLRTEIRRRGDGSLYVRKCALSKEGNEHILSFEHKYKLLCDTIENKELHILEPSIGRSRDGLMYADFAFLNGKPLSKLLSEEIREGRAPIGRIKDELEFLMGRGLCACHDLDLGFENIIVTDEGSFVIDYEWVFDTAPERDYVKYRILRYWYEAYKESLYAYKDLPDFLSEFSIKGEVLEDCEEKEASFQSFVNGNPEYDFASKFRDRIKTTDDIRYEAQRLKEFTDWNLRLQDEVEEHKTAIRKLHETERLSQNHIRNIENINAANKAEIERLTAELSFLRRHQSIYARLRGLLVNYFDRTAPQGSRKRKLIHYAHNTLRHPVKYMGRYLSKEGRLFIKGDFAIGGEFEEGGLLKLPETGDKDILVSIVLPAYNQVSYTYACIRSIIEHTDFESTPYEVILADDVSTDATAEIESYISGLVLSRNTENLGFLKNCNKAAELARGRYIFFLNNDTKVTEGWLSSLVSLMEADDSIGMTGSKLIYPDGRLQEAGGIIWSDASGWNYGRLDDPEKPEYNYVKEVDYISGAAIMIRSELWKEIGGFDERYAPAYCEDSDLAFEVRKHGKRVVLQPKSVVVHFEGISNGTDVEGSGLKRYQLINNDKFKEKWAEELKKQSVNDGSPDPFKARDRSQGKKCILVIDHYVPTWDKDAGSKTTYQYLKMFVKKGFNVKFLGDNFLHEEPYTLELEQLGIEVLYGDEYKTGIWDYIEKHAGDIDIAYLNRPHIAAKYIDFIKDNTPIKCIYYGHDLHFLRLEREYELTDDIRVKREADYWKSVELSVMDRADAVYYPSEEEIAAIKELRPELYAKAITAYVWDSFSETDSDYGDREGLLFVGGFAHPPNEDGLLWFASEVFPKVRAEISDIKLHVVGSNATERVEALSSEEGMDILGFVSDERLSELYRESSLVVVPLRYGAGVKGKVVEALYYGSAIVTTEVGAEGIPEAAEAMDVVKHYGSRGGAWDMEPSEQGGSAAFGTGMDTETSDISLSFAHEVVRLYRSKDLQSRLRSSALKHVRAHYSMDAAWDIIRKDFE